MSESISYRTCKRCDVSYPLTPEFWHKDKKAKEGLSYYCKECAKAKSRQWHGENREYANKRSHEWHKNNLDRVQAYRAENAEHIARVKRAWRQNNPEKVKEHKKRDYEKRKSAIASYHKQWRAKNADHLRAYYAQYHIEHSEEINARARAWYENNKERAKKRNALHYERNKEAIKAYVKQWVKDNPEKARSHSKVKSHNRRAREIATEGVFTVEDIRLAYRVQRGNCWHCGKHVDQNFHADHLVPLKQGGTNWPNNLVVSCSNCNLSKGGKLCYQWNGKLF